MFTNLLSNVGVQTSKNITFNEKYLNINILAFEVFQITKILVLFCILISSFEQLFIYESNL